MNRAAAILLLPIMIIFAIQPVIALHYCGGELRQFNLFSQHTATDVSPIDGSNRGINHSCCDAPKTNTSTHNNGRHILGDHCCDTQLLVLTTDDYQAKAEKTISRILPLSLEYQADISTRLFKLAIPLTDPQSFNTDFPPEGLFLKDVSLLTYICIYRI